jgi:hypothetical protein
MAKKKNPSLKNSPKGNCMGTKQQQKTHLLSTETHFCGQKDCWAVGLSNVLNEGIPMHFSRKKNV